MLRFPLLCLLFLFSRLVSAQSEHDTVAQERVAPETTVTMQPATTPPIVNVPDSIIPNPLLLDAWEPDTAMSLAYQVFMRHPYFAFASTPVVIESRIKTFSGKELMFYTLIGYLLFFALLRQAFSKYFMDLFRLFFRTTIKQRQIREQLIQTPLPSLLFNAFFVLTTGFYINLLVHYYEVQPVDNYWLVFLYCCLGLSVIYAVKFLGLKISGWLFNMNEAANAYIFVVFLINKVIGIFLLPFIVLLSFTRGNAFTVALVLSWCGIGLLLLYRLLLTYVSVRNLIRFNLFHFLIYLLAFEVAPLLLVYKALLFFFR